MLVLMMLVLRVCVCVVQTGKTALMEAAEKGHVQCVELLLLHQAALNQISRVRETSSSQLVSSQQSVTVSVPAVHSVQHVENTTVMSCVLCCSV